MDSLIQFHLGLGDRFCIGDLRTENYENFKLKLQKNLNLYFKEDMNPYLKFKVAHQNIGNAKTEFTLILVSKAKPLWESTVSGGGRGRGCGKEKPPEIEFVKMDLQMQAKWDSKVI